MSFLHSIRLNHLSANRVSPTRTQTDAMLFRRFAGDLTPSTLRRADAIYDEVFPQLRDAMYDGFGAIELMVSPHVQVISSRGAAFAERASGCSAFCWRKGMIMRGETFTLAGSCGGMLYGEPKLSTAL